MVYKLAAKHAAEVTKNKPWVETLSCTKTMLNSKKTTINTFCTKLLPAIILPLIFSGAKYWIVAFNGTINKPPEKPKTKEQSANTTPLWARVKKNNDTQIPNAPSGTIPNSICKREARPARYEPSTSPIPLTARIAWMTTALSSLNIAL